MEYDVLGRKTAMDDPDMGEWFYYYDDAGNLIAQVDARHRAINFYYDDLNRLLGKTYATTTTPSSYTRPADPGYNGYTVKHYFDETGYGSSKGRRTRMVDSSGSTEWTYDSRGRVTEQENYINGGGTFKAQWGYDSLDRVTWTKYPGGTSGQIGEQVNATYTDQGLPDSLVGVGTDPTSKAPPTMPPGAWTCACWVSTKYVKIMLTIRGRRSMAWGGCNKYKVASPPTRIRCKNLRYTYDAIGNVATIKDYKAGGIQTQTFTYDALDRLKTAVASGGSGGTYGTQTYSYNAIGNMTNNGSGTLSYPTNGVRPHAVTGWNGNTYGYDANGNQTTRTSGGSTATRTYDAENRLTTVSGADSASFVYDGDGNRIKATPGNSTTYYVGTHYEYRRATATPVGNGLACLDNATGSGYLMYSEESVFTRFSDAPPWTGSATHFVCVKYNGGWQYDTNTAYVAFTPRASDRLVAAVDYSADTVTALVGQSGSVNGIAKGYESGDLSFTANWWAGGTNAGEFGVSGTYWAASTRYYYAGGQRVAMRENGTLTWLLGDHLGSASVTADANGGKIGELRYYPYGATRHGAMPTARRYTGQIEECGDRVVLLQRPLLRPLS